MLCPICKTTPLTIQDNNYYCPGCKIFIGKVDSDAKTVNANFPANQSNPQQIIPDKPVKDNLGLINNIIKKSIFFLIIIFLIYKLLENFFYVDIQNKCFIRISPSWLEFSNASMKEALGVLHTASPVSYQNVCNRVSVINPNLSCGGFGGGCFSQTNSRTIDVSTFNNEVVFAVVAIVHETCHVQQRDENKTFDEKECYATGYKVLKDIIIY